MVTANQLHVSASNRPSSGVHSPLPTADYNPGYYYSLAFFITLPTYLVLPSLT